MTKKGLLIGSSLISLAAVAIAFIAGVGIKHSDVFAADPEPNAEYTISTWKYDGWCKNAGITGYYEQGRVLMFHSTSEGAGEGAKVRGDVKLAVILNQMTDQDDIEGNMDLTLTAGMPSLVCNEHLYYNEDDHHNPVWPANYMAIYTVRIMIGDFTFEGNSESGILTENEDYGNFVLKSFMVNTTMTYAVPDDDQAGNWHRCDMTYPKTFTQTQTTIGDHEGHASEPHIGIAISGIIVTYGCTY